jgi:hypothetical protein
MGAAVFPILQQDAAREHCGTRAIVAVIASTAAIEQTIEGCFCNRPMRINLFSVSAALYDGRCRSA